MSVIRKPNEQGISDVTYGGVRIGTLQVGDNVFIYISTDGKCKGDIAQRNLAVKALMTYYRSNT